MEEQAIFLILKINIIMIDGCLKVWDLETEKNVSSLINAND